MNITINQQQRDRIASILASPFYDHHGQWLQRWIQWLAKDSARALKPDTLAQLETVEEAIKLRAEGTRKSRRERPTRHVQARPRPKAVALEPCPTASLNGPPWPRSALPMRPPGRGAV